MARPIVKLKPGAVPKLLKSPAMQRKLAKEASRKARDIPNVRVKAPVVGRARARTEVVAQTPEAAEALKSAFRS